MPKHCFGTSEGLKFSLMSKQNEINIALAFIYYDVI